MPWVLENERWWWKPNGFSSLITRYETIHDFQVCPAVFRLINGNPMELVLSRPASAEHEPPFVAQSPEDARQFARDLIGEISTLHRCNIRLGLSASIANTPGLLAKLVVTALDGSHVLACQMLGNITNQIVPEPIAQRWVPKLGVWPYGESSWQRKFLNSVEAADRTAIADWQAVLRIIYFHLTATRFGENERTEEKLLGHANASIRKLALGRWSTLRSAFLASDSDILHWGLGFRTGYRGWLKRMAKL